MMTTLVFIAGLLGSFFLISGKILEMRRGDTAFTAVRKKGDRLMLQSFRVCEALLQKGRERTGKSALSKTTLRFHDAYTYGARMFESRPIRMVRASGSRGLSVTKEKVSHYLQEVSKVKERRLSGKERERIGS